MSKAHCAAQCWLVCLLGVFVPQVAAAQAVSPVYNCVLEQGPTLVVDDKASPAGALIHDVRLITLHNGLRAVTFSTRYSDHLVNSGKMLRVRYTIDWTDDCGRPVRAGANVTDGFVLNPNQHKTVQSVAFTSEASRARVHIYVESPRKSEVYEP